ncbi:hypothetical protein [Paraburkholderia kururiensis]|uniref:hypothetical protein n=1 Tax=Paraburkholderia kururiensis TaxID=984307 RepID=UPI0005A69A11|nr:hypothetical protein [Paraburkholderia kururiensis]
MKRGMCSCCRKTAARRVDIQVNWFRGDDEVLNLCSDHYAGMKMASLSFSHLFELAESQKALRRKENEIARERAAQRKAIKAGEANA